VRSRWTLRRSLRPKLTTVLGLALVIRLDLARNRQVMRILRRVRATGVYRRT
jgi:hypothetical protein